MQAEFSSNVSDVERDINELVATFGFEIAGVVGKSLGEDIVHAVADAISEDCRQGTAPDGSQWADNKEPYKTWKADEFGVFDPGYLRGDTLSIQGLVGEVEVSDSAIVQRHGIGAVDETGAVDKDKGEWLTNGGRPFYAFNQARADRAVAVAAEGLERHIGDKIGG